MPYRQRTDKPAGQSHGQGRQQMLKRRHLSVDVHTLALERIAHIFSIYDTISIGFSGGKDSTAVLQLTIEVAQRLDRTPIRVLHHDEEAIPHETEQYVRRVLHRHGPDGDGSIDLEWHCEPFQNNNACSRDHPYWYPWAPEDEHLWCRPMPPEHHPIPGFPREPERRKERPPHYAASHYLFPADAGRGRQIHLMGIRAQESMNRQRAVSRTDVENYITLGDPYVAKGYPIYDWRTEDVWTAPNQLGWDYNHAYDAMAMAGITPHQQRCSPAYGNEPLQKLWVFAHCFPDVWERMCERVPGAAAAARYATTELYAFGEIPPKPPGMGWAQFIRGFVMQHEPAFRGQVAERVQFWIRNHYNKTTDPLVPDTPHPDSGVNLNWLTRLAMRGDRMERQQAGARATSRRDPEAYAKHRARYQAELDTYSDRMEEINLVADR